ncbi:MAG: SPOR domain-containing protein [Lysobacterales bacterium]|jgi:cell division septation protein DedD
MDIALKQRLVGAVVLIALAVIVLPMLLGGRPESGLPETRKIELPPQPPEMDFETRRFPVGESSARTPRAATESEAPGKALPTPASVPTPREEEPQPAADAAPAEAAKDGAGAETALASTGESREGADDAGDKAPDGAAVSASEPVADAAPPVSTRSGAAQSDDGRYVVQVASFGSMDNANRLSGRLRDLGYNVLLDTIKSDVGTLNRVRVGPYATESSANQAVTRLSSQIDGVRPRVMDLQPDRAAQVTSPSDPLVRWVVQVGSFSSATNADNLVARLRTETLSAYKEQVNSGGSTIYRVRVGPFLERDEAIRAERLVKDRLSLDGVVMSDD